MMIRINLLPHRQIKRAERKRQLGLMAIATVVLGAALVFMGHGVISGQLAAQQGRNQRLIDATAKLDKEIEEIKNLKADIKNMLDRKQVVENLQSNRSQAVVLLDEIARQLPESVYLKSVKQAGNVITLQGYADSNNRVAVLVRSLTASKWLESPALIETHSEIVNNQKLSNFTLTVSQKAITSATEGNANQATKDMGKGTRMTCYEAMHPEEDPNYKPKPGDQTDAVIKARMKDCDPDPKGGKK